MTPAVRNIVLGQAGPSLDLNFLSDALDPRITFTRSGVTGSATYFNSAGVLQTARVNSLRNSTMVGIAAGSPGTLPTNWSVGSIGTLTQTISTGTDEGMAYIDIRLSGTSSTSAINLPLEATNNIAALQGQSWTHSVYYKLIGTATNSPTLAAAIWPYSAAPALLTASSANLAAPTTSFQRGSFTYALPDATTAWARPVVSLAFTNGVATDFTIRIAAPQLELGATASTFIPTTTVANGAPRFDYDPTTPFASRGLLIEEARTNLWPNSADASQASWAKTGITVAAPVVTANQVAAPDGALTAAKVVYPVVTTAGHASYLTYNSFNGTVAVYSFSVWLKGNVGGEQLWLGATPDAVTYYRQSVTLTTAWQRFTFITSALTAVNWFFTIGCDRRDASQTAIAAQTIFVWGAQLELGAFPTSYIPTTTVAVARGGDVASMPLGSWFNAAAGTIVADGMFPLAIANSTQGIILLDDGTAANRWTTRGTPGGGTTTNSAYVVASVGTATINAGAIVVGTPFKLGAVGINTGISVSLNGAAVQTNAGAAPTGLTTMRFGQNSTGAALMNGYIRRVRYWPRLLPDGQLLAATR